MSHILSQLLNADEPLFSLAVKQLEQTTARPSEDVRLIADMTTKAHAKITELGLDPRDTTGPELYAALMAKMKLHDAHLAAQLGSDSPEDVQKLIPLMKAAVDNSDAPKSAWVLKKSVAKRMLKETPPPNIMKHLHYTSVDSLIKRENLGEVYGAMRFAESPAWLNTFNRKYKKLRPSDFETRDIEVVIMPRERWGDIAEGFVKKRRHNITHLKELGVILMLPTKLEKLPGISMTALPLLFHYLNEIRLYSAFFKLQQVKPDFGKIIAETLVADLGTGAILANHHVHWRVIQRYYGKLDNENHPEIFEPHVQPEDLHWRKAEEDMYDLDPELAFWRGLDYAGVLTPSGPVVFNLIDVSMSYCTGADYDHRIVHHFRESLWNEVFMRYMGHKILEQQILQQLDNDMIKPEKIRI